MGEQTIVNGPLGKSVDQLLLGNYPPDKPTLTRNAGFQICMYENGDIIIHKAYGLAKLEPLENNDGTRGEPLTIQHQMGIASNTKKFTALMLLCCLHQRKWSVNDRILERMAETFPDLDATKWWYDPNNYPSPSFAQLMSMSAGFEDISDKEGLPVRTPPGYKAYLRYNPDLPDTEPEGARLSYSNRGAGLAGYLVTLLHGKSYPECFEEILKPDLMEMEHLVPLDTLPRNRPLVSHEYAYDTKTGMYQEYYSASCAAAGATGLHSNAGDAARFMQMLLDGGRYTDSSGSTIRILDEEIVKELVRPRAKWRAEYADVAAYPEYCCFLAREQFVTNGIEVVHYYHDGANTAKSRSGFFTTPKRIAYHWQHNTRQTPDPDRYLFDVELIPMIVSHILAQE